MNLYENNKIIKEFKEILTKDEIKKIENIVLYIRSSNYSKKIQEEILFDTLTMIKDGNEKGKSIDDVIGKDHEEFLEDVFKNISKDKEGVIYFISYILGIISSLQFLYIGFKNGFSNILDEKFYLSNLVIYLLIFITTILILNTIQKTVYNRKNYKYLSILGLFLVTFVFFNKIKDFNLTAKGLLALILIFFILATFLKKNKI